MDQKKGGPSSTFDGAALTAIGLIEVFFTYKKGKLNKGHVAEMDKARTFKPTQSQREQVLTLVAARTPLPDIAAVLSISVPCLLDRFAVELKTGRAVRMREVIEQLRKAAKRRRGRKAAKMLLQQIGEQHAVS